MENKILAILSDLRPEFDFTQKVDFIEEGMLDSFDIVALVDTIETQFGVSIQGMDILPENFSSIEAINKTIERSK